MHYILSFVSCWCQGLAEACDCGTHSSVHLTFYVLYQITSLRFHTPFGNLAILMSLLSLFACVRTSRQKLVIISVMSAKCRVLPHFHECSIQLF